MAGWAIAFGLLFVCAIVVKFDRPIAKFICKLRGMTDEEAEFYLRQRTGK